MNADQTGESNCSSHYRLFSQIRVTPRLSAATIFRRKNDLPQSMEQIEGLIRKIENLPDPEARASAWRWCRH